MTIPKVAVDWVPTLPSTREAPGSSLSMARTYPNEGLSSFLSITYSNAEIVPWNTPTTERYVTYAHEEPR